MKKIIINIMQANLKRANQEKDFDTYINLLDELIEIKEKNECDLVFENNVETALDDDITTYSDVFLYKEKDIKILKSDFIRIEDNKEATYIYIIDDKLILNENEKTNFKGLFVLDKKNKLTYSLNLYSGECCFICDFKGEKANIKNYFSTTSNIKTLYKNIKTIDINKEHYILKNHEVINLIYIEKKLIAATLKNTIIEYIEIGEDKKIKNFIINKNIREALIKNIDVNNVTKIMNKLKNEKSIEKINNILDEIKELESLSKLMNDKFELNTININEIIEKIFEEIKNPLSIKEPLEYNKLSRLFMSSFNKITEKKQKKLINKNKLLGYITISEDNFNKTLDSDIFSLKDIEKMKSLIINKNDIKENTVQKKSAIKYSNK